MWKQFLNNQNTWYHEYSAGGFIAHTFALELEANQFLIVSPGPNLTASFKEFFKNGEVKFVLVPSSYHSLGIREWMQTFPEAVLVSSRYSKAKVKRIGFEAQAISVFNDSNEEVKLIEPDGLKSGEVIVLQMYDEKWDWYVCDLILNIKTLPDSFFMRSILKFFKSAPGLSISNVILWFGTKSKRALKESLKQMMKDFPIRVMYFNHGEPIENPDDVLIRLISKRL